MTPQEFSQLKRGDIVRHVGSGDSYVIERSKGDGSHVAIRSIVVTNTHEWILNNPGPPKPREWWIYPVDGKVTCAIETSCAPGFVHVRELLP